MKKNFFFISIPFVDLTFKLIHLGKFGFNGSPSFNLKKNK